jgi:cell wall-associated NlpC family hydrolase
MGTIIYSPGVSAVAFSSATNQFVTLSRDITGGNLTLNENNLHSLNLRLSNPGGKYSSLFTPNDRIVVSLKRTKWLQVFSGYLDKVPYFMAYPREVEMTASCTLKRIKYHYWDQNWATSVNFMIGAIKQGTDGVAMKTVIYKVLTQIVGWSTTKIHIGGIPPAWQTQVKPLWNTVETLINDHLNALGTTTMAAGQTVGPGYATATGGVWTASSWAQAVLNLAGLPSNQTNISNILHWMAATNKATNWWNKNNPMCTSFPSFGYSGTTSAGGGTGSYPSLYTGALASAATLKGTPAKPVYAALMKSATPTTFAEAIISTPLASGHYAFTPANITTTTIIPNQPAPASAGTQRLTAPNGITSPTTTASGLKTKASSSTKVPPQAPNAAGAVQAALDQLTKEYRWGVETPAQGFTCSALMQYSWSQVGVTIGRTSETQYNTPNIWILPIATAIPGDLLFWQWSTDTQAPPGHVSMYIGNGDYIEAPHTTAVIHTGSLATYTKTPSDPLFYGVGRVTLTGKNNTTKTGGSTAISNLPQGSGNNDGLIYAGGVSWNPSTAETTSNAQAFTGYKVLMQDTPIHPLIHNLVQAGQRSYCSAPNGDFISWFPDYFGQYGATAIWNLTLTELIDCQITWSDENLITHQFTAGAAIGNNMTTSPLAGATVTITSKVFSYGVASIDIPRILELLFNLPPTIATGPYSNIPNSIYEQFGARPNYQTLPTVGADPEIEFWYALHMFRKNWVAQFSTTVQTTFMPELYPGMLLAIKTLKIQGYITQVSHSWDLSNDGGFTTSVRLMAPSSTDGSGLIGLAVAGRE